MDCVSTTERSRMMSRVRGKDTKPEKAVRSMLHQMGYRFRLHRRDLPGCPDIVLVRLRKVIFVHGCFWHGHCGCRRATRPSTHVDFWNRKIEKNIAREALQTQELRTMGWDVLVVWECQTRRPDALKAELARFWGHAEPASQQDRNAGEME